MSSLKFAVLCVLAAYLLVVAFNFITKLRDARLMQKLLCMLFPISQICLIAFPLHARRVTGCRPPCTWRSSCSASRAGRRPAAVPCARPGVPVV